MNKLSTGQDSTLGNWLSLCERLFGKSSDATTFVEEKILTSPNKENEEVVASEGQFLMVLSDMHFKWLKKQGKGS